MPFYEGNVTDGALLRQIFDQHAVAGVVHLAGFKYAGVSVSRPLHTYTQNVTGMVALLEAMAGHDVTRFVFSSSAAVYGTPETGVVTEATPTRPESPYGESKLVGEWLLADQARATADADDPLRHTSLRYFNVVGSGYPDLRDTSPHNLFPLVFDALAEGRVPHINGDRLPHPGRHLRPRLRARLRPGHLPRRRRAGAAGRSGRWSRCTTSAAAPGCRSGEIMDAVARVTGIDFTPEVRERRPGDPAQIVATGELAARDLDWKMRHTRRRDGGLRLGGPPSRLNARA